MNKLRIDEIYRWIDAKDIDQATDILFQDIDNLLSSGEFDLCNELIQNIDLDRFDTNLLVGLLSITYAAHDKLPYRKQLYAKIEFIFNIYEPDRINALLVGLNPEEAAPRRAETGAMQFGNDWPGIFIRGDNAFYYAFILEKLIESCDNKDENYINLLQIKGLVDDLKSCMDSNNKSNAIQLMKSFDDCRVK